MEPFAETERKNRPGPDLLWIGAGLFVLLGAVCVAAMLGRNGFWIDELFTLNAATMSWTDMVRERMVRGHPPLYFALMKVHLSLATPYLTLSESLLRLPSYVFWLAAVLSFPLVVRRHLARGAAVLAVLLLAMNQLGIQHALNARMYSMVLFFSVWIMGAWLALITGKSRHPFRWTVVLVVCGVAGCLTSPSVLLVLLGLVFDAWFWRTKNPRAWRVALLALAAGCLTYLPAMIAYFTASGQIGPALKNPSQVMMSLVTVLVGTARGARTGSGEEDNIVWRYVGSTLAAGVLLLLLLRRRSLSRIEAACFRIVFLSFGVAIPAAVIGDLTGTKVSFLGSNRYLIGLVPFGAVMTASIAAGLDLWRNTHLRCIAGIGLLVFLGGSAISASRRPTEPFREAIQAAMLPRYRPGEQVMVLPREIDDGVRFYVPGADIRAAFPVFANNPDRIRAEMDKVTTGGVVWLVQYRGHSKPVLNASRARFGPPDEVARRGKEPELCIWRFDPAGSAMPRTPAPR